MDRLLGAGAYATVYKGRWNDTVVAVKISTLPKATDELVQRALFEAHISQRCQHPNLVITLAHKLICPQQPQPPADLGEEIMTSGGTFVTSDGCHASCAAAKGTETTQERLAAVAAAAEKAGAGGRPQLVRDWEEVEHDSCRHGSSLSAGWTTIQRASSAAPGLASIPSGCMVAGEASPQQSRGELYMQLGSSLSTSFCKRASTTSSKPPSSSASSWSGPTARPSFDCDTSLYANSNISSLPASICPYTEFSSGTTQLMPDCCKAQGAGYETAAATGHFSLHPTTATAPAGRDTSAPGPHPSRITSSSKRSTAPQLSVMLVLEYCDKGNLQEAIDLGWLRRGCRPGACPSLPALLHTAQEVARGLAALHAADIVHGDLSAYNVLLSCHGVEALAGGRGFVAKIGDFGLSMPLHGCKSVCVERYGITTHMAPEVLARSVVSRASDVYSFGVVLWQMLTGCRPWEGLGCDAVRETVVSGRHSLQLPECVHPQLALLCSSCLCRQPQLRPAAAAVADRLGQLLLELSPAPLVEDF